MKLSEDELRRLEVYGGYPIPPVDSGTMSPGGGSATPRVPDASRKDIASDIGSPQHPRQGSGYYGGAAFGAGSAAVQALYATDAVKKAFAEFLFQKKALILDSDDDDDDDSDNPNWEDRMDPVTFARYYAPQSLLWARFVQEHDDKMREHFNEGIFNWLEDIQTASESEIVAS